MPRSSSSSSSSSSSETSSAASKATTPSANPLLLRPGNVLFYTYGYGQERGDLAEPMEPMEEEERPLPKVTSPWVPDAPVDKELPDACIKLWIHLLDVSETKLRFRARIKGDPWYEYELERSDDVLYGLAIFGGPLDNRDRQSPRKPTRVSGVFLPLLPARVVDELARKKKVTIAHLSLAPKPSTPVTLFVHGQEVEVETVRGRSLVIKGSRTDVVLAPQDGAWGVAVMMEQRDVDTDADDVMEWHLVRVGTKDDLKDKPIPEGTIPGLLRVGRVLQTSSATVAIDRITADGVDIRRAPARDEPTSRLHIPQDLVETRMCREHEEPHGEELSDFFFGRREFEHMLRRSWPYAHPLVIDGERRWVRGLEAVDEEGHPRQVLDDPEQPINLAKVIQISSTEPRPPHQDPQTEARLFRRGRRHRAMGRPARQPGPARRLRPLVRRSAGSHRRRGTRDGAESRPGREQLARLQEPTETLLAIGRAPPA